MSRRGASLNSLTKKQRSEKFTPGIIHNKITLNFKNLIEYFKNHTLDQCADKFNCSLTTVKRKLKEAGIDTSIHNHSKLAYKIQRQKRSVIEFSKEQLYDLYIIKNLDSKSIAEQHNVHYNTIRKRIREYGFKKENKDVSLSMKTRHFKQHGYAHPAQRPDVIAKTRKSAQRAKYISNSGSIFTFRSLHELSYALYLDENQFEWVYEEMCVPYVDNMTGKWRSYVIDFTVIDGDKVEWVEIKPNKDMIPIDKRIYASRRAEDAGVIYRGVSDEEKQTGFKLLLGGKYHERIEFLHNRRLDKVKQISYHFKSLIDIEQFVRPPGFKKYNLKKYSDYLYTLKLRRQT